MYTIYKSRREENNTNSANNIILNLHLRFQLTLNLQPNGRLNNSIGAGTAMTWHRLSHFQLLLFSV